MAQRGDGVMAVNSACSFRSVQITFFGRTAFVWLFEAGNDHMSELMWRWSLYLCIIIIRILAAPAECLSSAFYSADDVISWTDRELPFNLHEQIESFVMNCIAFLFLNRRRSIIGQLQNIFFLGNGAKFESLYECVRV